MHLLRFGSLAIILAGLWVGAVLLWYESFLICLGIGGATIRFPFFVSFTFLSFGFMANMVSHRLKKELMAYSNRLCGGKLAKTSALQ
ncbi:MAG: hypothetical protein SFT81_02830 [Candidatus Caenarcaniphilales bacterium]|nr:hypothetical protein [Candidatus Caenarcaniphilales bacterium]